MTDIISDSIAQRRFFMLLLTVFALVALFLAAVGLYGVVAYRSASERRKSAFASQSARNRRRLAHGNRRRHEAALVGAVIGIAAATRGRASGLDDAVRGDALRSGELRRDRGHHAVRQRTRLLHPRSTGDGRRPAGRAATAVKYNRTFYNPQRAIHSRCALCRDSVDAVPSRANRTSLPGRPEIRTTRSARNADVV